MTLGEEGLRYCRELGEEKTSAWFLLRLGQVAYKQGQYERATALLEESLNASDERSLRSVALGELGHVARYQGDYDRAAALYMKSLVLLNETGDKWHIALAHRSSAYVALHQGDHTRASALLAQGITLCRELGDRYASEQCLEGFARVASARGHYEQAVRLFGAADALREILGYRSASAPPEQALRDQSVLSIRAALGHAAFASTLAEGRAMTLEQAVEYALVAETRPEEGHGSASNVAPK